jgi:hypothetical protein
VHSEQLPRLVNAWVCSAHAAKAIEELNHITWLPNLVDRGGGRRRLTRSRIVLLFGEVGATIFGQAGGRRVLAAELQAMIQTQGRAHVATETYRPSHR